ncbi:hypothetical protein B0H14DRAFT_3135873 [Mycena olivaceomarginata]|nr:hypothetical protein B0H14DRAFT_3135873 [Mycena olivaceomarginata]
MRFLANAHLVVLGLLSLGITAYAQEHCRTSLDCGPNECCNTTELVDLSRSRGPIVDVVRESSYVGWNRSRMLFVGVQNTIFLCVELWTAGLGITEMSLCCGGCGGVRGQHRVREDTSRETKGGGIKTEWRSG